MKDRVRENFDVSSREYEAFESRAGLFEELAGLLLERMAERSHRPYRRVLDAGAGSGASTRVLRAAGLDVVALDISRGMLQRNETTHRVQGDFDDLPFRARRFDAVAFTASLFLTPSPTDAVAEARRVVRPGGTVGAVAPRGWSTPDGRDVFDVLAVNSRSPTPTAEVEAALRERFEVSAGDRAVTISARRFREFHAIPAIAARLYPRLDPEDRVERTARQLENVDGPLRQRWRWIVGVAGTTAG